MSKIHKYTVCPEANGILWRVYEDGKPYSRAFPDEKLREECQYVLVEQKRMCRSLTRTAALNWIAEKQALGLQGE